MIAARISPDGVAPTASALVSGLPPRAAITLNVGSGDGTTTPEACANFLQPRSTLSLADVQTFRCPAGRPVPLVRQRSGLVGPAPTGTTLYTAGPSGCYAFGRVTGTLSG